MPKSYIVSVGTSLFTNYAKEGQEGEKGEKDLAGSLPPPSSIADLWEKLPVDWPGYKKPRFDAQGPGPALWALRRWGSITMQNELWKHQTAEIASLARIGFQPEDRLYLLASYTPRGMFSALVNAFLLSSPGKTPQVGDWDWESIPPLMNTIEVNWGDVSKTQQRPIPRVSNHPVSVFPVKGLNPSDRGTFEEHGVYQLMRSLVYLVSDVVQLKMEPEIIFTGGFKASVPVITQAAIWIADCWECSLRMQALYEDSDELVCTPILANRPSKDACRAVLAVRALGDDAYLHRDLACLDVFETASRTRIGSIETSLQPLFVTEPIGDSASIKLSVLGKALLAIVEGLLTGRKAEYWRDWIKT